MENSINRLSIHSNETMNNGKDYLNEVDSYYRDSEETYDKYWSKQHIHYGIWLPGTENFEEALENTTLEIARRLNIQPGNLILDAGCGTGGSAHLIANRYSCKVYGITFAETHFLRAKASETDEVRFWRGDFNHTEFEDASFDGIYAIESVCHTPDKSDFIKEAKRLLKPEGRLILSDYFLNIPEHELKPKDVKLYRDWISRWSIQNLAVHKEFQSLLIENGFVNVINEDFSKEIYPTSRYMSSSKRGVPILYLLYKLGRIPRKMLDNHIGGYKQKQALDRGIWSYRIISAIKG